MKHSSLRSFLFLYWLIIGTNTCVQVQVKAQSQSTKVLFIGNSYTGSNNLPNLVYEAALSTSDTIIYDRNTPGGATLSAHTTNANTLNKIQADDWDYVVIQAQSQEPSFPTSQVETQTFPYAAILCDSIRSNNACSRPLFYMTWGRENGDAGNCAAWPPICTYEGMDSLLNLRYRMMADMNEAYVSPVGAVWRYIRDNHPSIQLYSGDGSHPSQTGSYAAACTFYATILQKDPTLITYNYTLDETTANIIKEAAKIIAFDDLSEWNFGDYDPTADFSYEQDGYLASFTHDATYYEELFWDFGDGNTSTDENPTHEYASTAGTYTISLTASQCGISSTTEQTILIISTSTTALEHININTYPSPSNGIVYIENTDKTPINLSLYNVKGQLLINQQNPQMINLTAFDNGIYFITLENQLTHQKETQKIILKK